MRLRVVGQNSAEVADAVRDGHLEAGLVVLPVDDRGLDVRPAMQEELLYLSAEPRRVREPMTIEKLAEAPLILYDARWGADDPMRRQLRERAQRAGVKIELEIEVEYMTAALDLAQRGLGDTIADRAIVASAGWPRRLRARRSTRRCTRPSPSSRAATRTSPPPRRAFIEVAEKRVAPCGGGSTPRGGARSGPAAAWRPAPPVSSRTAACPGRIRPGPLRRWSAPRRRPGGAGAARSTSPGATAFSASSETSRG